MQPKQPRPSLARLTDNKFAALVRLFMSSANPRWTISQDKGGYAHNTKDSWSRALQFAIRPDCLGDVSLQDIRPSLVQAFFDGIADKPGKQKVTLTVTPAAKKWLAEHGHDPRFGARPLGRLIENEIARELADQVLFGKLTKGGKATADLDGDKLAFSYEPNQARQPAPVA